MLGEIMGDNELIIIFSLFLSVLTGFIIGLERELREKDAGVSTHILVITGSMLFSYLSSAVDPESTTRIASQVVSGIGFLGAGLILKEGSSIKNLTTAASLWVSAAIGMAFGFGFYTIGILVAIAVVFVPRIPRMTEKNLKEFIED